MAALRMAARGMLRNSRRCVPHRRAPSRGNAATTVCLKKSRRLEMNRRLFYFQALAS